MDVHKPDIRSYNMSRIRGKDTKPEMLVRRFLHAEGFRYRVHVKELPGKPDIVLRKYNTVIFIHGCFWHGHDGCKYFKIPSTKSDWWLNKINRTKDADRKNIGLLREKGWHVIELWECDLRSNTRPSTLATLPGLIRSS